MERNASTNDGVSAGAKVRPGYWKSARLRFFVVFAILTTVAFIVPLKEIANLALESDLQSHILLIPFVSAYLIYLKGSQLAAGFRTSLVSGCIAFIAAAGLVAWAISSQGLSETDRLSVWAGAYLMGLLAGAFLVLGKSFLKPITFPVFFLIFIVPMPDGMATGLENWLMAASAIVSEWFFDLCGIPVFREGQFLQLPGMALEVARECSGIRSTWVLFITSLIVAYLFSSSPWRRAVLVLVIFPLGVLRNGLRILVIGSLCVYIGPQMIHSWIHHHGGPVFFAVSLVPVFLLTWWLRRSEVKGEQATRRKTVGG